MAYQTKIKRYTLILEQLSIGGYPSANALISKLTDQGLKLSERQLKRDIESLRFEFGLEIHYSVMQRGYYLESSKVAFPYFLILLEFSQNAELLSAYLKKGLDISDILDFEDFHSFKGTGLMQSLALAILNRKELLLGYKRFDAETEKEYFFRPYLLREYLNRWYVIGYLVNNHEIRTFGLDRIIRFSASGKSFNKAEKQQISKLFKHVVGINAAETDQPIEIQLCCQPYLASLLKTLPLHASQQLVSETPENTIFKLNVVINYELKQRLLMIADQANVLSPESLKTEMREMIEKARKNYS